MNPSKTLARSALLPLLAAALALPSAASAAELYVSPDGAGTCLTVGSPCDLQSALIEAQSGDRILVAAGVYGSEGPVWDSVGKADVTIMAVPGDARPVLDLGGGTLRLTHGTNLRGLDLITSSGRALLAAGGVIEHVRAVATGTGVTAIELGDDAVLRNSSVVVSGSDSTGVSVVASGDPATLIGVTLVASGSATSALRVEPDYPAVAANARVVNTILRRVGAATELTVGAFGTQETTVELDHVATDPASRLVEGPGVTLSERAGLAGAPLFLDRANGDLRQMATSPTIDAGTADVNADGVVDGADLVAGGTRDLDGSTRRLGLPDIGADEREMPPVVLGAEAVFDVHAVALRAVVQPRGLATTIAADWAGDDDALMPTGSLQAPAGNDPVTVTIPLGNVPVGAQTLRLRTRAANSAGSVSTAPATVEIPAAHMPPIPVLGEGRVDTPRGTEEAAPAPAASIVAIPSLGPSISKPKPVERLRLPGARPTLLQTKTSQASGQFGFRLKCRHTVSCRGQVLLTRLGPVRVDTFKIPPGQERTVQLSLTSAQAARVRKAGKGGLRGLLEVRSLDDGSTWTAVRLFSSRWR